MLHVVLYIALYLSMWAYCHLGEADLVFYYVKSLIDAKVDPSEIAVIAPYNLQVRRCVIVITRHL